eukprot:1139492-Pelagomonas_calceolata.AAC.1
MEWAGLLRGVACSQQRRSSLRHSVAASKQGFVVNAARSRGLPVKHEARRLILTEVKVDAAFLVMLQKP